MFIKTYLPALFAHFSFHQNKIKMRSMKYEYFELFSRALCDSTPPLCPFVGPSFTLYFFLVFAVFGLTAPAQMIE